MTVRELLRKCQGDMTQTEFATRLSITQPGISKLLSGQREPDARVWAALIAEFPELRETILDVFLSSEYGKTNETMAIAQESAA